MVTAIRAAIMLTVLVGLPAAWVYYGPLPDGAQRVVDRFFAAAREAVGWDASEAMPAQAATPIAASTAPQFAAPPSTAPAPTPSQPPLARQMEPLLVQLRQLGVAEYALEPWGADGGLYRFHCEMPLAAGAQATEQFEAIAADPHATVEQVVAEVSSWHAARRAGGMLR
jgi:hypothetical protein